MLIPMEISALNTDLLASSITAINVVLTKLLMLTLLPIDQGYVKYVRHK